MASARNLELLDERGWRRGFANLLGKESGEWWRTRRWWVQALLWLLIVNGVLAIVLWVVPAVDPTEVIDAVEHMTTFMRLMAMFPMFAVIVITQGAIIGEKQSGTAAWILSAPVSRSGFILSKLLANAIGFGVTIIVVQGLVAYIQLSISGGSPLPLAPYLANLGLISLYLMFYLALTTMLGTFYSARGPVLGIAIGVAIASMMGIGQLLAGLAPWLILILPESLPALVSALVQGEAIPAVWPIPILVMALYTVLFVAVAILRFNREEF